MMPFLSCFVSLRIFSGPSFLTVSHVEQLLVPLPCWKGARTHLVYMAVPLSVDADGQRGVPAPSCLCRFSLTPVSCWLTNIFSPFWFSPRTTTRFSSFPIGGWLTASGLSRCRRDLVPPKAFRFLRCGCNFDRARSHSYLLHALCSMPCCVFIVIKGFI